MVATDVRIVPGGRDSNAGDPVPLWSVGSLEHCGWMKMAVIVVKGQVDAGTSR